MSDRRGLPIVGAPKGRRVAERSVEAVKRARGCAMCWASIHWRMRLASATRVYLPNEFSSTMTTGRSSIWACITRHWPASLMKPVFCTVMSQAGLRTSEFVFRNCSICRPTFTSSPVLVEYSRIDGLRLAAITSLARSFALDTFWLDRPDGSTNWDWVMPSASAFAFMARTNAGSPPGKLRPSACAARFSDDISARCRRSARVSFVPTARREKLPRVRALSAFETSMISSIGSFPSSTTRAVMSLVIDAIGAS